MMQILDCTIVDDIFIDLIVHVNQDLNQLSSGGTTYSESVKICFGALFFADFSFFARLVRCSK
jgi:hypothetical protein